MRRSLIHPLGPHEGAREAHLGKEEMVLALASKVKISKTEARRALAALFDPVNEGSETGIIAEELVRGGKVVIADFGTFKTVARKAREGTNPNTGERIQIPDKRVVRFTAGAGLRKLVESDE